MENLWPDDLLESVHKPIFNQIEQGLISQADGLRERTNGLLTGFITDRSFPPSRAWAFGLYPVDQPAKETQLFIIRSQDGKFPIILESFDPSSERYKKITGLSAFRVALQELFLSLQTRRIVKLLVKDAIDAGEVARKVLPKRQKREARSILLGSVVQASEKEFSHVSIFGVSGFIDKKDVERFLMSPDEPGSPIAKLNEKYVITFHFIDSCKLSVSNKELQVLQAEARKSLGIL